MQIAPAFSTLNISDFDLDPEFFLLRPIGQPALLLRTLTGKFKCPQNARPGMTHFLTPKSMKPSKSFLEVDGFCILGIFGYGAFLIWA